MRGIRVVETGPAPDARAVIGQVGDASRLRACSGWSPAVPLERSLRDLLDEWRARAPGEA